MVCSGYTECKPRGSFKENPHVCTPAGPDLTAVCSMWMSGHCWKPSSASSYMWVTPSSHGSSVPLLPRTAIPVSHQFLIYSTPASWESDMALPASPHLFPVNCSGQNMHVRWKVWSSRSLCCCSRICSCEHTDREACHTSPACMSCSRSPCHPPFA